MFDVSDWNDGSEAQSLPDSLGDQTKQTAAAKHTTVTSRKKRLKRTQQLLEILRTLETPSNRETIHLLKPPTPPGAEIKGTKKEPDPVVSHGTESEDSGVPASDAASRLSRKQWRNKRKNKRRSKNKFKASPGAGPAGEQHGADQESGAPAGAGRQGGAREPRAPAGAGGQGGTQEPRAPAGAGRQGGTQEPRAGKTSDGLDAGTPNQTGKKRKRLVQKEPVTAETDEESEKQREGRNRVTGDDGAYKGHAKIPAAPHRAPAVTALEKQRMQKLRKIMQECKRSKAESGAPSVTAGEEKEEAEASPSKEELPADRSAALRARMEQRLSSARFRYINQQLYTSDSQEARRLFRGDAEAFSVYHSGFSQQVQRWPVNPVTEIIKYIKNRPPSLVVADFGCGDALLARSVRNEVHSFDLVAMNERVTVCDISKVPLADETVDVAVFCLSLMGTNFVEFLQEANRVLKMGGVLLVAEVSSRFDDVRHFLSGMSQLGFKNVAKSTESSHFFMFEFVKNGSPRGGAGHPGFSLKPCLYKKR
ncbi:ribosomal RNA-processing protein 8 [Spea bombifrons]|uniref:ribosomal RNA-processing protein 8 n=1 Tax=Spea bombifrons TaxID=233779 RepID=UPI00234BCBB7|nr:ribosomal RNA-processing protein 8 [Spea bombifrons]